MRHYRSRAFTLVELLVVIAIIGVLVSMMLPGVQAAREAARRAQCTQNIGQLMIAAQSYESAHELLPPGVTNPTGPIRNEALGMHHGWIPRLLPYMDEANLYRAIDFEQSVYAPANSVAREMALPAVICPSSTRGRNNASGYAGCHHDVEAPIDADNRGVLFLNSQLPPREITDGASHTIFLGEKKVEYDDLGWVSGTRATLRNAGTPLNETGMRLPTDTEDPPAPHAPAGAEAKPGEQPAPQGDVMRVGGFASEHPGSIVLFGFCDGSVHTLTEEISARLFRQFANRADGEILESREY